MKKRTSLFVGTTVTKKENVLKRWHLQGVGNVHVEGLCGGGVVGIGAAATAVVVVDGVQPRVVALVYFWRLAVNPRINGISENTDGQKPDQDHDDGQGGRDENGRLESML